MKSEKIWILVFVSICFWLVCTLWLCLIANPVSEEANEGPLRFQEVQTFSFRGGSCDVKGTVYQDTKTGIEYLYIYRHGGIHNPAITRLWEK